jgi:hypothetical protein
MMEMEMTDEKLQYRAIVKALHEAYETVQPSGGLAVYALISLAIEIAFTGCGPKEGRELVLGAVKRRLAEADAMEVGTPAYYAEPH